MQLKEAGENRKVIRKVVGVSIMNVQLCNQGRSDLSQSVALSMMVIRLISSLILASSFSFVAEPNPAQIQAPMQTCCNTKLASSLSGTVQQAIGERERHVASR